MKKLKVLAFVLLAPLALAGCDSLADLFGIDKVVGDQVDMTHTGGDEPARMAVIDRGGEEYSVLVEPSKAKHIRLDLPEQVRFRVYHHQSGALLAQTSCQRQEGKRHDAHWYPWENRVQCVIR